MAWVPFIVANRRNRYYRKSGSGVIVALIVFFLFLGVFFFFFFNRFNGFTVPIWIIISGVGGFLIFIAIIGAIAASMSKTYKRPTEEYLKSYQYNKQNHQINPYTIPNSVQKQSEDQVYRDNREEFPIAPEINYCRYCGAKTDEDANFCQQCGIKL